MTALLWDFQILLFGAGWLSDSPQRTTGRQPPCGILCRHTLDLASRQHCTLHGTIRCPRLHRVDRGGRIGVGWLSGFPQRTGRQSPRGILCKRMMVLAVWATLLCGIAFGTAHHSEQVDFISANISFQRIFYLQISFASLFARSQPIYVRCTLDLV